MRLDVVGKNLLAGRELDHVLLATDDVEMARPIEASEVAGVEPSVSGECFAIRFRVAIVTRHDDGTADRDFADALFVRLIDPDFDAVERRTHRSDFVVLKARDGGGPGGLAQAVALQDGEAETMKILRHARVEASPGRNGQPQSAPE